MAGDIRINAQTQTPAEIFNASRCFTTPDFQRPYIWTGNQIDELWHDITALAVRPDAASHRHFAGAILLQDPERPGRISQPKVIDGQQRLTTLQLAIAALRAVYAEQGHQTEADEIYGLYLHNGYGVPTGQPELAFKMEHGCPDDGIAFRHCPQWDNPPQIQAGPNQQTLLPHMAAAGPPPGSATVNEAYGHLAYLACRCCKDKNSLDATLDALLYGLTLAIIQAKADEPTVYTMFSRLNAAGTPLSTPDKVKAETFSQINQLADPADQAVAKPLWEYTDLYWRLQEGTGQNQQPHLGHLLHYWLGVRTGQFVTSHRQDNQTLNAYREEIARHGIITSLASLRDYAGAYRMLQTRQPDQHHVFVRDFHISGYSAAFPLALYCLTELHQDARESALADLRSYLMRLALADASSSALNRTAIQVAAAAIKRIHTMGKQIPPHEQAGIIRDELLKISGILRWPDDEAVIRHLIEKPVPGRRAKEILTVIADHLQGSESEVVISEALTLEHIMPVQWQRHWPPPHTPHTPDSRARANQTLGNLTLLHGAANNRASNSGWRQKRDTLAQSSLAMNRRLAELPRWDEAAIRRRTKELALIACQIWPKPYGTDRMI